MKNQLQDYKVTRVNDKYQIEVSVSGQHETFNILIEQNGSEKLRQQVEIITNRLNKAMKATNYIFNLDIEKLLSVCGISQQIYNSSYRLRQIITNLRQINTMALKMNCLTMWLMQVRMSRSIYWGLICQQEVNGVEITFNNFYEFAEWIHKTEKHREELEQENIDLTKEVRQLRSELKQIKNATATSNDETLFNTESVPHIFRKREQ